MISQGMAQSKFTLHSKVKEDTLWLRVVPEDFASLLSLTKTKAELTSSNQLDALEVPAGLDREYSQLLSGANNTKSKKIAWAAVIFKSSTDKQFAMDAGLLYALPLNLKPKSGNLGFTVAGKTFQHVYPSISNTPEIILEGKIRRRVVELSWLAKPLNAFYTAYDVMVSTDSAHWKTLNAKPLFFAVSKDEGERDEIFITDTLSKETPVKFYRLRAYDYFADNTHSSPIIKMNLKKLVGGSVEIDSVIVDGERQKLYAHYVSSNNNGYVPEKVDIYQSKTNKDKGQRISSGKLDKDGKLAVLLPNEIASRAYYFAEAIIPNNDTLLSYPKYTYVLDQVPPRQPQNLIAQIDSNGIVELKWDKPEDNDIMLYKVFRRNAAKEEWISINANQINASTSYTDSISLNNLSPKIYYCIAAVDSNYNNSPKSEPVELIKPDIIPPVPSRITAYLNEIDGITISGVLSSSLDLKRVQLIRTGGGTRQEQEIIITGGMTNFSIKDTSCLLGETYTYQLITSDISGNTSKSKKIRLEAQNQSGLDFGLDALVVRKERMIILKWNQQKDVYGVRIYRQKNDGDMVLLKTITDGNAVYKDKDLFINNSYSYRVQIMHTNGKKSPLSEVITLEY